MDMTKIAALAAQAVAKGADMTKAVQGGGDYTPPPEGPCNLRFVAYIELGKHEKKVKGVPKTTPRVQLVFEVSGKKYPAVKNETTGEMVPVRVAIEENLSLNDKAHFFKLFTRMNYAGDAQHMAQLLGRAFRGEIVHDKWKGQDGKERVTATLRDAQGYTIKPPRIEDEDSETGWRMVDVAPPISPLKCFLWDFADLDQWAGLYIPGEFPERTNDAGEVIMKAKSKNVLQNKIKLAKNFQGSVIHTLLLAQGRPLDIPDAEDGLDPDVAQGDDEPVAKTEQPKADTPKGAEATDALNGIV